MFSSAIHKAAGLTVSRLCLVLFHHSIVPLKNVALGVYGSRRQERPPETVLYSSRQSGGFVNRAVNTHGRSNSFQLACTANYIQSMYTYFSKLKLTGVNPGFLASSIKLMSVMNITLHLNHLS